MTITPDQLSAREKWVEALESGEFAQCQKKLFDGIGYCCLGVAEVSIGHRFEPRVCTGCDCVACTGDDPDYVVADTTESVVLTPEAQNRLGFTVNDPAIWVLPEDIEGITGEPSLATLNDNYGLTLAQIAAVIRAQPEDWDGSYR